MKEKTKNFTFCLCCFFIMLFIFKNNKEVSQVIIDGVNLFFKKVFVSLFPMFILNDFFIYFKLPYYFNYFFGSFFKKTFKTSGNCAYVFFMSLLSGTPSQAYILKNLWLENKISQEEAEHYLAFTYFSNLLFLITMLSLMFPSKIVFKIILIHYFSNILIGLFLRKKAPDMTNTNLNTENTSLGKAITKSISKSMNTLLMILGTIVFYILLCFIISKMLPNIEILKSLVAGFLEITNGLNQLIPIILTSKIKEIIAISIISFGGLSIHTQIMTILEDTPISYLPFLKGRILQTLFSIILIFIF